MTIKVGDYLWCKPGFKTGEEWQSRKVVGETSKSWLVTPYPGAPKDRHHKVSKAGLLEAYERGNTKRQWFTEEGMRNNDWLNVHRQRIASWVGVENDIHNLKSIAAIVGYDPKAVKT